MELRQPGGIEDQGRLANRVDVGEGWPDAVGLGFKTAELRARAAVASELFQVKSRGAHSRESASQRQVLGHRSVQVEDIAGLVIRGVVLGVEVHGGIERNLCADFM